MPIKKQHEILIASGLNRAPILWERRRRILDAIQQESMKSFRDEIRASVLYRDQQAAELKAVALSALSDNGFHVFRCNSPSHFQEWLLSMANEDSWARSSSRLGNYLCGKLDMIQTDIWDNYARNCLAQGIFFYPRNQTLPADYRYRLQKTVSTTGAVTGCNAVTTQGQLVIIENTGNINNLLLSDKVVTLVSDEKLVPAVQTSFLWQQIYHRHGLRSAWGAHTHIISGPAFTDTLPEQYTPYGSNQVHVVWAEGLKIQYRGKSCIECGLCMEACPAVELYGAAFTWNAYTGGIGILKAWQLEGIDGWHQSNAWMCNGCGRCSALCPNAFDIAGYIREIGTIQPMEDGYLVLKDQSMQLLNEYLHRTQNERTDFNEE